MALHFVLTRCALGHRNITCLYDMDIVGDPRTYNEVYLYEGQCAELSPGLDSVLTGARAYGV